MKKKKKGSPYRSRQRTSRSTAEAVHKKNINSKLGVKLKKELKGLITTYQDRCDCNGCKEARQVFSKLIKNKQNKKFLLKIRKLLKSSQVNFKKLKKK